MWHQLHAAQPLVLAFFDELEVAGQDPVEEDLEGEEGEEGEEGAEGADGDSEESGE